MVHLFNSRVTRFLLVGAFNTAVTYGAYALLLLLGLAYALAYFLALVLGVMIGFKTQGVLVFQNPDNRLFPRFIAFWGVLYVISIGLIALFMRWGLNAYVAGALALPVITALSFVVQNWLVFRRRSSASPSPRDAGNG